MFHPFDLMSLARCLRRRVTSVQEYSIPLSGSFLLKHVSSFCPSLKTPVFLLSISFPTTLPFVHLLSHHSSFCPSLFPPGLVVTHFPYQSSATSSFTLFYHISSHVSLLFYSTSFPCQSSDLLHFPCQSPVTLFLFFVPSTFYLPLSGCKPCFRTTSSSMNAKSPESLCLEIIASGAQMPIISDWLHLYETLKAKSPGQVAVISEIPDARLLGVLKGSSVSFFGKTRSSKPSPYAGIYHIDRWLKEMDPSATAALARVRFRIELIINIGSLHPWTVPGHARPNLNPMSAGCASPSCRKLIEIVQHPSLEYRISIRLIRCWSLCLRLIWTTRG
ncbi:hypothetical protein K505DRAFT_108675 [Melanomma pulvis-pyrius CBS 109.77]|uniref:Uncharacterized protein n=1 Tax=Melanomma pulvis-pyrius CBS 109.77 TaxID=1314802 RepID=A0A6A6XQY1_9PLEO|nr:hypothetical protein K505DRAFT_108675 [Melanomma pulvis-pyrius CBS 109.77]